MRSLPRPSGKRTDILVVSHNTPQWMKAELTRMAGGLYDHGVGHVFISYSHRDGAYVDRLTAYLAGAIAASGNHSVAIVRD